MLFEAPVIAVVCIGADVVAELGVPDCTGVDMVAVADGVVGLGAAGFAVGCKTVWVRWKI